MRLIWSPTRDLLQLHARLGRALGDPAVRRWAGPSRRAVTMPPLDFSETPASFLIRVDLPGVRKEDVEVSVVEGQLEIAGEASVPAELATGAEPLRLERFRGPFRRLVPLPRHANGAEIKATLERGVLTLEIPKSAPAGGQRIEVG